MICHKNLRQIKLTIFYTFIYVINIKGKKIFMFPIRQSVYDLHYFLFSFAALCLDSRIGRFLIFTFALTSTQTLEKTCVSKAVCDDRFSLNENLSFPVVCDEQTKAMYLANPRLYTQHFSTLSAVMSEMKEDPQMYCKMVLRAQHPDFSVSFCSKQTMFSSGSPNEKATRSYDEDTYKGVYSADNLRLCLLPNEAEDFFRLRQTTHHEWHHAYISARNEHYPLNQHRFFSKNNKVRWGVSPCKGYNPSELGGILQSIRERLEQYVLTLNLLEARQQYRQRQQEKINTQIWIYDERYKEKFQSYWNNQTFPVSSHDINYLVQLAQNYEPMIKFYTCDFSAAPTWMFTTGILDENKQVLKRNFTFSHPASDIRLYGYIANVDSTSLSFSARTVSSMSLEDRIKAILLDGVFQTEDSIKKYYEQGHYCANLLKEMDAYLHEVYAPYPKIFSFLCPELKKYHESIDNHVLQSCLSRTSPT